VHATPGTKSYNYRQGRYRFCLVFVVVVAFCQKILEMSINKRLNLPAFSTSSVILSFFFG